MATAPVLKCVGYWAPPDGGASPYPHPRGLVRPGWRAADRDRIVAYLRSGHVRASCLGFSICRFGCGIPDRQMGSRELTDGEWTWPEGLAHYIESHSVCLPEETVTTMEDRGWKVPGEVDEWDLHRVDETFWLAWSAKLGESPAKSEP